MLLAGGAVPSSPLALPIQHIRSVRAEKEMRGIHTTSFVAAVANVHSGWNRTVLDLPRPAMSQLDDSVEVYLSIASAIDARLPDQTAGDWVELREMREALFGGPMRGAMRSASIWRTMVGFHVAKLEPSKATTYYGQWTSRIVNKTRRKTSSIDQKAALARRFSTGFSEGFSEEKIPRLRSG